MCLESALRLGRHDISHFGNATGRGVLRLSSSIKADVFCTESAVTGTDVFCTESAATGTDVFCTESAATGTDVWTPDD